MRLLSYSSKLIENICQNLLLDENIQNKIKTFFFNILKDKDQSGIFFNKNTDYIILCSIYFICKTNKTEIQLNYLLSR